jgi:hypothetical protein
VVKGAIADHEHVDTTLGHLNGGAETRAATTDHQYRYGDRCSA